MKDISSVLNLSNTGWKTGKYPLFLGEELGLHDSMNRPYPEIFRLFKKMKSLDWSENEVNLSKDRMDFETVDKNTYDVMIKTLSWQFEADSLASRSIVSLFAPFISNNDLSQLMLRWSDNEALHALTYSEIVRQCLKDPDEVFEEITGNKNVTERSSKIAESFSNLKTFGAKYILDKDSVTSEDCREVILKTLVSLYCLEQMEFMASFACTFALAERDLFLGIASLVQKIMIDETMHTRMDEAILDILMQDPEWVSTFERIKPDIQEIVDTVYKQELSWSDYIFSEGRSIVGLNPTLLKEWVEYKSQIVYNKLELEQPFEAVQDNPLSWMDRWLDIDGFQQAAQETDLTNYRLNSVVDDTESLLFDFGHARQERCKPKHLTVFSKPECPFCVKLKKFLRDNQFEYSEIDVSINPERKQWLLDKGLKTVPQVFEDDGTYQGDCTGFINKFS
ncbi:ribonucleoside diphosphate reductase subunit beta [Vibrio phage eugene 12A10]|uniref:ribonucleoside diphosphate reductase subunit beta n=1 Tax=Vibrio phage eugene 12A10 TaxID=573172 RepID=UPI0003519C94|nr:ribonucleoside diphosphate reductase subunit beta [Vibrio phage eugene 12A10]AGN51628.1 ribonucleoside diphosphate reductase subunit beta [Vibrio phage eugene 12A10]